MTEITTINMVFPFASTFFGGILAAGAVYIVAQLFLGGLAEAGFDTDVSADADSGESEALGISLNVIAAFCVGVGAMGLVASLNDWSVIITILSSLLFGVLLGRLFQVGFGYVLRQQHSGLIAGDTLVGNIARVTVDTPAGKLGEAMLEEPERMKYPIKHMDDAPLSKGETVVVIKVEGGRLYVRRK